MNLEKNDNNSKSLEELIEDTKTKKEALKKIIDKMPNLDKGKTNQ